MNVEKKYFDITINENSFYFSESSIKPKMHGSALATLKKIEEVVKKGLEYRPQDGNFSHIEKEEILNILKFRSEEIDKGYSLKTSKLLWIFKKLFANEKQVSLIRTRIENLIVPAEIFPLPKEVILKITTYLERTRDLFVFGRLNQRSHKLSKIAFLKRVQEWGYRGKNYEEAVKHFQRVKLEIKWACLEGKITKTYISYRKKEIDIEKTIQNLRDFNVKDLFALFKNEHFVFGDSVKLGHRHSPDFFQFFIEIAKLCLKENASVVNTPNERGFTPLHLAAKYHKDEMVEFLLDQGADANLPTVIEQKLPLFLALDGTMGYVSNKCVELLLPYIRDINAIDREGSALLHYAISNKNITLLLLQKGADVNKRDRKGNTPLHRAVNYETYNRSTETISLLLRRGADIHARNAKGLTPQQSTPNKQIAQFLEGFALGQEESRLRIEKSH